MDTFQSNVLHVLHTGLNLSMSNWHIPSTCGHQQLLQSKLFLIMSSSHLSRALPFWSMKQLVWESPVLCPQREHCHPVQSEHFWRSVRRLEVRYCSVFHQTCNWRKVHSQELHNLYTSLSISSSIKLKSLRWAQHIAYMSAEKFWPQNLRK